MEPEEEELDQVDARKFIDYFDDTEDSIGNERQVLLDEWFSAFVIGKRENFKNFFDKNIEDDKEPWVQNEGVQRITQSMVNKLDKCNSDTHSDIRKYTNMFKEFLEKSSISPDDILAKVLEVIDPMLNAEQEQYANCLYTYDWTKHRNTCLVLVCLLDCDIIIWKSATHIVRRMLFEYFLWIIEECSSNWETLYFAVIAIQKVVVRFGFYRQRLVEALQKVISVVEKDVDEEGKHNCPIRSLFKSRFDSFKFQLELCVKWFQSCVLESSDLRMLKSPVRMLPNKLSARCSDVAKYCNAYSNFQVETNVYYFEVILITDGPMRIGWNCNVNRPGVPLKLGYDIYSIALDGYHKRIYHNSDYEEVSIAQRWKVGDVIGCLITIKPGESNFYDFYINGIQIQYKLKTLFYTSPKFNSFQASATLFSGQQCYFNFGQERQFKYSQALQYSGNVLYIQNFHAATGGNVQKYDLSNKTNDTSIMEYLQNLFVIEQFGDNKQKLFDIMVISWLNNTKKPVCLTQFHADNSKENLKILQRLCQSVVNLLEGDVNLFEINCNLYRVVCAQLDKEDVKMAVLEMLNMFELNIHTNEYKNSISSCVSKKYQTTLRNKCLMFVLLFFNISYLSSIKEENEAFSQLLGFLLFVIEKCMHQETVLYALFCIEMLVREVRIEKIMMDRIIDALTVLTKYNDRWHYVCNCRIDKLNALKLKDSALFEHILKNKTLRSNFVCSNQSKLLDICNNVQLQCSYCVSAGQPTVEYQIGYFASSCLYYVKEKYNSHMGQFYSLKFSSDYFSVSNELHTAFKGTAHSIYSILLPTDNIVKEEKDDIHKKVRFFYESFILTNGPMVIGWTTLSDIEGDSDLIGLDLYHSQVLNKGHVVSTEKLPKHFNAGDVVGCMLEISTSKAIFTFWVNGQMIDLVLTDDDEGSLPSYYAAVKLTYYQHCYMNFGQAPFKHPPENDIKYETIFNITNGDPQKCKLIMKNGSNREYKTQLKNEKSIEEPFKSDKMDTIDEIVRGLQNNIENCENIEISMKKLNKLSDSGIISLMKFIIKDFGLRLRSTTLELFVGSIASAISINEYSIIKEFVQQLMPTTDVYKCERNISIVLLILVAKHRNKIMKDQYKETILVDISPFIFKVILRSNDNWSLLFAILCLDEIYGEEIYRIGIKKNKKLLIKLGQLADSLRETKFSGKINPVKAHVGFCAQHFLDSNKLLSDKDVKKHICTLEPSDNMKLLLSSDRYSARNYNCLDPIKQNVYSTKAIVDTGTYFCEVVIFTSGSVIIGWKIKDEIYHNEIILLDLLGKKIKNGMNKYSIKSEINCPAGSVVGCLVNVAQGNDFVINFEFYLNGDKIEHENGKIEITYPFTEKRHLSASLQLSLYQTCYCNFGQQEFRFPPKDTTFESLLDLVVKSKNLQNTEKIDKTKDVYQNFIKVLSEFENPKSSKSELHQTEFKEQDSSQHKQSQPESSQSEPRQQESKKKDPKEQEASQHKQPESSQQKQRQLESEQAEFKQIDSKEPEIQQSGLPILESKLNTQSQEPKSKRKLSGQQHVKVSQKQKQKRQMSPELPQQQQQLKDPKQIKRQREELQQLKEAQQAKRQRPQQEPEKAQLSKPQSSQELCQACNLKPGDFRMKSCKHLICLKCANLKMQCTICITTESSSDSDVNSSQPLTGKQTTLENKSKSNKTKFNQQVHGQSAKSERNRRKRQRKKLKMKNLQNKS